MMDVMGGGGQKEALNGEIYENLHVLCFHVNLNTKTQKHVCFHVNFPFSAYFYPPPPIHNGKGFITMKPLLKDTLEIRTPLY